MLVAFVLIILSFVTVSGCSEAYKILETYVPTVTLAPTDHVEIGKSVPASTVKDVTIRGQGNTITIRGRGPYNMEAQQDYFTLNKGNAEMTVNLKGQGFGCTISMDYINPLTGNKEIKPIHQFTIEDRAYQFTKQVDVPYTCKYCMLVNWGGDWEIKITQ
jgi:hypothetical protein